MIHLFNRQELLLTSSQEQQAKIRDILAANGIECYTKTKSSVGGFGRSRTVMPGMRTEHLYQYYIYVKKDDYKKAKYLIR